MVIMLNRYILVVLCVLSVAPTELIYKYNLLSGVYTPAYIIQLLRSLFLSDTIIGNMKNKIPTSYIQDTSSIEKKHLK